MKRIRFQKFAFTLVELLIALMVSAIILSAVVTLSYAMNNADRGTDALNRFQAELRFTTVKINDLVRFGKLITNVNSTGFHIWQLDKDNDAHIDTDEIVLIEFNTTAKCIQMVEFSPPPPPPVNIPTDLLSFINGVTGPLLKLNCNPRYTILLHNCNNVNFITDQPTPYTRLLSISFDTAPLGVVQTNQISANLRCWAGFQLDETGGVNSSDDDGKIQ